MIDITLSIIVPMYNVGAFIERCARSLFSQTINQKEVVEYIFVNDCSPDNSEDILKKIIAEYPKLQAWVKVIRHEHNKGLFMARRTGLLVAKGEYVIHIDSDDWVEPTMMEEMVNVLRRDKTDMCYCGIVHDCVDGQGRVSYFPILDSAHEFLQEMVRFPHLWSIWNKMYRRDIALRGENDLGDNEVTSGEDLRRNIVLLLKCGKISCVDKTFYHYCENPASISKSHKDYFPDMVANGNFMSERLSDEYSASILYYKRTVLLGAIIGQYSPSAQKLFSYLWPEVYKDLRHDKSLKRIYRIFIYVGKISYKLAWYSWKVLFMPYAVMKSILTPKLSK